MQEITFQCSPEEAKNDNYLENYIRQSQQITAKDVVHFRWKKRSIDARKAQVKVNCTLTFSVNSALISNLESFDFKEVTLYPVKL